MNGAGSSGFVVNSDVRRQLTFGTSVGVNNTFRIANGETSVQTLAFVDFSTAFGSTRAEAGWSHDPISDLFRVGWTQNWSLPSWLPAGSRLSTQLSFDHRNQNDAALYGASAGTTGRSNNFSAAISGGASPFNGISFDGSLAYSSNAARTVFGHLWSGRFNGRHFEYPVLTTRAELFRYLGSDCSPFLGLDPVGFVHRLAIEFVEPLWAFGLAAITARIHAG